VSAARRVGCLLAEQMHCLPTSIRIDKLIANADIRLSAVYPLAAFIRLHEIPVFWGTPGWARSLLTSFYFAS
jgi:hypothetical protein